MPPSSSAPRCAPPDPRPRPPPEAIPRRSCDTHLHICGPEARYRYSDPRIYTPPDALLSDYLDVARALGIERVVLVQPSVYGADNTAMLDAMRECPLPCRAVAVIDEQTDDAGLRAWHAAGVRGVRLNLVDTRTKRAGLPQATITGLAERIAPLGWHLELLAHVDDFADLDARLRDLPVDLVFGHLGYTRPGATAEHPGFKGLLRLLERGRSWVKLTGPYRLTTDAWPYAPVAAFAAALLRAAPDRLVWGSDWPHVMLEGAMPN
ncbi:MAG TPA: amidohydrolase family protein, partial [Gammaproteobacteria bacterium]|nr:amidohydrolase family protein [Gammaproteobacteria bacterium]